MNQVVEKLWELQSALSQLAEKEEGLSTKPESFAAVDREYQSANREIEGLTEGIEKAGQERRKIERDLQEQQEVLKKYQGQLMQVKNQQQYAAAWKEIDVTRKQVKDLEESLLAKMTEIDDLERQLEARSGSFDELKGRYDTAYEQWQSSLGDLRAEVEAIRGRIVGIESSIPPRVRQEFQRIFKSRQGVAMSRVENGSCGACRVRIRPQANQQLLRGEMVFCEGCRRIFYLETVSS